MGYLDKQKIQRPNLKSEFEKYRTGFPWTLIGSKNCPYVQRVIMFCLYHTSHVEILYLEDHPEMSLIELSPTGKVPVLVAEGMQIFESNIIAELVDSCGNDSLFPDDMLLKSEARSWMHFGNDLLLTQSALFDATSENWENALNKYNKKLSVLENKLGDSQYFMGANLGAVDIAVAPLFQRLDIISNYIGHNFLTTFPRVEKWGQTLLGLAITKQATVDNFEEIYLESILRWQSYLRDKGNSLYGLQSLPALVPE